MQDFSRGEGTVFERRMKILCPPPLWSPSEIICFFVNSYAKRENFSGPFKMIFMYFKRVFRLFLRLFSQIVGPPSELQGGTGAPPPVSAPGVLAHPLCHMQQDTDAIGSNSPMS